jgi:branched-chain amino acid transport system substrate-binding protein
LALPLHAQTDGSNDPDEGRDPGFIPIGLMIPDSHQTEVMTAARLAVDHANARGGSNGTPFRLVVRSAEGPWGSGSKESVSLVFEDRVVAMAGALDGRNGHLAEQVATKSHLAYVETFATESTLSQAFVPFFMRVVPSDDQQAAAILTRIQTEANGRVAVVYDQEYDHLHAAGSFVRIAQRESIREPLLIPMDTIEPGPDFVPVLLKRNRVTHLVVPYRSQLTIDLNDNVRRLLPEIRNVGTLGLITGLEPGSPSWKGLEDIELVSPGFIPSGPGSDFEVAYRELTGQLPPLKAAFTYDGVSMITRAVRIAGTDRERIKDALRAMEFQGMTGTIAFDDMGNRMGGIAFFTIREGVPVPVSLPRTP